VTRNEARRIAANVAKLPEPVAQGVNPALKKSNQFSRSGNRHSGSL